MERAKSQTDVGEIEQTLRLFVKHDAITELRVVDGPRGGPVAGYFDADHLSDAATKAADLSGRCSAVYFVLNPVKPELLARANNRIQERPKQTTSDNDISERCWLPIDLDPRRASGISSTDEQHAAAFELADEVLEYLTGQGWPDPIYADSGNGVHLVYALELPNDDASRRLVEGVLKGLDFLFSNERVVVDTANGNAARIWKLYGTWAAKGDDLPDRPHRPSLIISAPAATEPVPVALLESLAGVVPKSPTREASSRQRSFDLVGWVRTHVDVAFEGPWQGGYKWVMRQCPWNSDHTNRSAFILQFPSGAHYAGCRHDGCKGKRFSDLQIALDPEYAARVDAAKVRRLYAVEEPAPESKSQRRVSKAAQEFHMKHVEWLWPGYLPLGKICDLQGDPGRGKSILTAHFAASVTGGLFPDGSPPGVEGGVIIFSHEDEGEDTIVPRLVAADADLSKVRIRTILDEPLLTLPDDLPLLEEEIREFNIRLVVFDPLDSFLSNDIDANKNQSIRRLLARLARMAAELRCTILLLRHLNKDAKISNPMYRGGGSIGLNAAAREVLLVGGAPDDPTLQVLAPVKANLDVTPPSLGYRIEGAVVEAEGDSFKTATIKWEGPVSYTGRDLLLEPEPERRGHPGRPGRSKEAVRELLRGIFADGMPHPAEEVLAAINRQMDVSEKTIERARIDLHIRSRKRGFSGEWTWYPEDVNSIEDVTIDDGVAPSGDPPF